MPLAWLESYSKRLTFQDIISEFLPRDEDDFIRGKALNDTLLDEAATAFDEAVATFGLSFEPFAGVEAMVYKALLVLSEPVSVDELLGPAVPEEWRTSLICVRFYDWDEKVIVFLEHLPVRRLKELMEEGRVEAVNILECPQYEDTWFDIDMILVHAWVLGLHLYVEPSTPQSTPLEHLVAPEHPLLISCDPETR